MRYKTTLMVADEHAVIDLKAFDSNKGKVVPLKSCDDEHVGSATIVDIEVETEASGRQRVVATFEVDYPINLKIETGDAIAEPQQKTGLTGLAKENDW